MADLSLEWNSDFSLTPAGDLALVDGDDLAQQRIVRRLFTAVRGYVWHPEYGAGLPQKIGGTFRTYQISSLVRAQMALEASVAQNPPPQVAVAQDPTNPGLQIISIIYTDAPSGRQISLTFSL